MQIFCKFGIIKIKLTSTIFLNKSKHRHLKRIIIPKPVKHLEIHLIKDGWMATLMGWTWIWVVSRVGDGQGSPTCYSPWGCKELDMTEWLNWTELCYFSYKMWQSQYLKMSVHFKVICKSNSTPVKIVRFLLG